VSLPLLVLIHEFGHFLFSRLSHTRVDKFYLFFNPCFSILRAKRYKGRWHFSWLSAAAPKEWKEFPDNTEWGIGWLPLGGYCKINGMIDESINKEEREQMQQPPQPYEYRAKAPWQRILMSSGGVVLNFIAAMAIYAMVLYVWGKEIVPLPNYKWGFTYCEAARNAGFRDGDLIVSIGENAPATIGEAVEKLLLSDGSMVAVMRDGSKHEFRLPADFSQQVLASKTESFLEPRFPFVIKEVSAGMPAAAAGMLAGDSVVGFDGKMYASASEISSALKPYANQQVSLMFYRSDSLMTASITLTESAKVGVITKSVIDFVKTEKKSYGFFAAIPAGISLGVQRLVSYVRQFKIVFTKEGARNLGGIGTIVSLFGSVWDWHYFWNITAFLSIMLAFLNILPIPAFDGGHMMFALYELVSRRRPSDKFMMRAQTVGMLILFALLLYANGNDIVRFFFN
jgi:regulator of sigma E protease